MFMPGEVGAIRIISASLVLLPFAFNNLKNLKKSHWLLLFCVGMFGSFLPAFLFAKAQTNLPSSVAGIVNALTPLFTMIIGALFFVQRVTLRTLVGLLIGFAGTIALVLAGSGGEVTEFNFYTLYVVLATIFYGANLNIIKFKIPDLSARAITSVSLMIVGPPAAIYLFLFTDFTQKVQHVEGAMTALGAVVLLGVMGTAIALILFNQLVKLTSPIFTSSVTYLIPVIAVFWGLFDGEKLYPGHYIGLVLIILGVYLSNRSKRVKEVRSSNVV